MTEADVGRIWERKGKSTMGEKRGKLQQRASQNFCQFLDGLLTKNAGCGTAVLGRGVRTFLSRL